MERSGNERKPLSAGSFLKKREPRVPETAADTRLGLGQVRSGSGISINRRIATVLFFLLLKPSRNAWRLPRIGAFLFQLWRFGGIFNFSFLFGFEKGVQMFQRMDENIGPRATERVLFELFEARPVKRIGDCEENGGSINI
jgi:hypothetical protein